MMERGMGKNHFVACSGHFWYPLLKEISIPCEIVPLSEDFIKFLKSESIFIPKGCFSRIFEADSVSQELSFSIAFERDLRERISDLGGKVFVKLNWSSPKDAKDMLAAGLDCRVPGDIYLLLKSSGRVARDIYKPFDREDLKNDIPLHLILKPYYHFDTCREFRVFVKDGSVCAVSQRDIGTYFPFLTSEREGVLRRIKAFVSKEVYGKREFPEKNLVLDVYFYRNWETIRIVDVNAWHKDTDPLLFSWEEISSLNCGKIGVSGSKCSPNDESVIRIIESESDIVLTCNINSEYPLEIVKWFAEKSSKEGVTEESFDSIFKGIRFQSDEDDEEEDDVVDGVANVDDFDVANVDDFDVANVDDVDFPCQ